jgi:hypothetical protein
LSTLQEEQQLSRPSLSGKSTDSTLYTASLPYHKRHYQWRRFKYAFLQFRSKKIVRITAKDTAKKYGETMPPLAYTVTVDGQDTATAGVTLKDLGLRNAQELVSVTLTPTATTISNVAFTILDLQLLF